MNDPLLDRLAAAPDAATADAIVETLVLRAAPVMESVAAYYRRRGVLAGHDLDDVLSTVRVKLLVKLRRIAAGERHEIGSFDGYVAALAYNGINDTFRMRDPERARFKRQLRSAVERDPRIIVETSARGVVCRLGDASGESEAGRSDTVVALLRSAGTPLLLDDVVAAMFEPVPERSAVFSETATDETPSFPLCLERRQDLEFLWREIGQLPGAQRVALLLNLRAEDGGNAVALLALVGVATLDDLARTIGIPREELVAMWNDLPLDDRTIASRLGLTRQQVINLRKSARERLGRKMRSRR